jgi:hypothetical protein
MTDSKQKIYGNNLSKEIESMKIVLKDEFGIKDCKSKTKVLMHANDLLEVYYKMKNPENERKKDIIWINETINKEN